MLRVHRESFRATLRKSCSRQSLAIIFMGVMLLALPHGLVAEAVGGELAPPSAGSLTASVVTSLDAASSFFDGDGTRESLADTAHGSWWSLAYGMEMAYGFSPTVGARIAWLPGFTFPSRYTGDENRRRNGASNLRLVVPVLLMGAGGATGSEGTEQDEAVARRRGLLADRAGFSLTAAPVGIIKIRGYDLEAQADRRQTGETYIAEHPDRKAHALGLALAETMALGRRTRLRASQEALFYFPADYTEQSLANYDLNLVREGIEDADQFDTIYYRYRLSGSLGGSYVLQEAPRTRWRAGLTVIGHYMPAPIVDDILVENTDSFVVAAEPAISVSPAVWNYRTSFELSWSIPLFGKNEDAAHEIALALRTTLYSPDGQDQQADDSDTAE